MRTTLLALTAVALSGCALKTADIPGADIPFAKAGYTVLGETTEESCGNYILGIDFGHLFSDQGGSVKSADALPIPIPIPFGSSPEGSRALFAALEKIPEATHLLDTRTETESSGILLAGHPIFGQRCTTVHAWGVKIDERPNPQQF
jgi:uncharacterized protein YceK